MSDLAEYTHLLNLYTWFNEASIQGLVTGTFNGNYGETELQNRATTANLQSIQQSLASPAFTYLFNKPNVAVSTIEAVDESDIIVSALRPGLGHAFINDSEGNAGDSAPLQQWKLQGWSWYNSTGLFVNNFEYNGEQWIGINVYNLEVVITVLVRSGTDNSVPPSDPSDPSEPSGPGSCHVDGIEFCDEEEDDCVPDVAICASFTEAN